MPSTEQLAHGGPDNVTVHLTLRRLQALHATAARLNVRTAGGDDAGAEAVAEEGSFCCCCCCCWDIICQLLNQANVKKTKGGLERYRYAGMLIIRR